MTLLDRTLAKYNIAEDTLADLTFAELHTLAHGDLVDFIVLAGRKNGMLYMDGKPCAILNVPSEYAIVEPALGCGPLAEDVDPVAEYGVPVLEDFKAQCLAL